MQARHSNSKAYDCPLTQKNVLVQLSLEATSREPEFCSNIGECGCDVVEIIYGMIYSVDWKRCCLYSTIQEQGSCLEN